MVSARRAGVLPGRIWTAPRSAGDSNPKIKIRSPTHQQGNDHNYAAATGFEHWAIGGLNLFRVSTFGFRISRPWIVVLAEHALSYREQLILLASSISTPVTARSRASQRDCHILRRHWSAEAESRLWPCRCSSHASVCSSRCRSSSSSKIASRRSPRLST